MRTWPEWGNRSHCAGSHGTGKLPVTYPATFGAVVGMCAAAAPVASIIVVVKGSSVVQRRDLGCENAESRPGKGRLPGAASQARATRMPAHATASSGTRALV